MSSGTEPSSGGRALATGPVQLAYGVDDVELAAHHWAAEHGAGPFFVRHHIPVAEVMIAGEPGLFDHSSAFGQWGGIMVELIAVHEPAALAPTGPGLHHVAYFVDSFDEAGRELTERGWPPILTATAGSTRFAFHDARAELGHLVEIYKPNDGLTGFYAMVAEAAAEWDGTDPIRPMGGTR